MTIEEMVEMQIILIEGRDFVESFGDPYCKFYILLLECNVRALEVVHIDQLI